MLHSLIGSEISFYERCLKSDLADGAEAALLEGGVVRAAVLPAQQLGQHVRVGVLGVLHPVANLTAAVPQVPAQRAAPVISQLRPNYSIFPI